MDGEERDALAAIRLKRDAEDRFLKRLDFGARLGRVVYIVFAAIVAGTLWIVWLQYTIKDNRRDIDRNRKAVEQLWKKVFGYEMPP